MKGRNHHMKGLIYKDFYLGRKFFLFSFLFFFITALLFVLIRLSMICGNLAHGILTKDEMDNIKTFSLSMCPVWFCLSPSAPTAA